jgi:hypothetical protein
VAKAESTTCVQTIPITIPNAVPIDVAIVFLISDLDNVDTSGIFSPRKLYSFQSLIKLSFHCRVIGLAVAFVTGMGVTKLVTALVADLIMPIIGAAIPGGDWRNATVPVGNIKVPCR